MLSNDLTQNIKYFNKPKDLQERWLIYPDGKIVEKKTGKLKHIGTRKDGYRAVWLDKHHRLHRLLALAFIPNPDNLPEVDHINQDKLDNRVENLRWVSKSEFITLTINLLNKVNASFWSDINQTIIKFICVLYS